MTYLECVAQLNLLFGTILNSNTYTRGYFFPLDETTRLEVYATNNPKGTIGCVYDIYTSNGPHDTNYFFSYEELIDAAIKAKKQND